MNTIPLSGRSVAAKRLFIALFVVTPVFCLNARAQSALSSRAVAVDPGVRGGGKDAGAALSGLTKDERNAFAIAKEVFQEVVSVSGRMEGEDDAGLGPAFNSNSCVSCHAFPAVGGSSPKVNPQVRLATLHGAKNVIPSFISEHGPVREARFKRKPDGSPDGGVHAVFVITGRSDSPLENRAVQTNFAVEVAKNNVSLRIPTPLFGGGLIEGISEETLLANKTAQASRKAEFGISGRENRNDNDGTSTRFGWKAQNKSLLVFAGEAYNVEQGVTNDLFPKARESGPGWSGGPDLESPIDLATGGISDTDQFTIFMRLLAAPERDRPGAVSEDSYFHGRDRFREVGCVLCHTEAMPTGSSAVNALSKKSAALFSDLLLHNMGPGLADDISQGRAGGDEFRTAPLWGLGQRIFFLHDGRTKDLMEAIDAHASKAAGKYQDSEANKSVEAFHALRGSEQQDLLNFLRSL
jgi:CxxC motif-containing protein (DUF1111 family)